MGKFRVSSIQDKGYHSNTGALVDVYHIFSLFSDSRPYAPLFQNHYLCAIFFPRNRIPQTSDRSWVRQRGPHVLNLPWGENMYDSAVSAHSEYLPVHQAFLCQSHSVRTRASRWYRPANQDAYLPVQAASFPKIHRGGIGKYSDRTRLSGPHRVSVRMPCVRLRSFHRAWLHRARDSKEVDNNSLRSF